MSYDIIPTVPFVKQLKQLSKKHRSIKKDVRQLVETLKENPTQGIQVKEDCYKIRMAITSKGKGKSGGARVITWVQVTQENVYLLSIYDKSQKENISDKELESYLEIATELSKSLEEQINEEE